MENIELFKNIKDADLDRLLGCTNAESKVFKKNEAVIKIGEKVNKIGIVLVGELKVLRTDLDGNDSEIETLGANSVFGVELASANTLESPVSVIATRQTGVLFLPYKKIIKTCSNSCEGHNTLIKNILEIIAKKNVEMAYQLELVSKTTTREKVLEYLKIEAKKAGQKTFNIPHSREEMAKFLCVDRSAMSRELSKLNNEGVLKYKKNEFTFLK